MPAFLVGPLASIILGGGLFLALGGLVFTGVNWYDATIERDVYKQQFADCQVALGSARKNVTTMELALAAQNEAVAGLKAATEQAKARAAHAARLADRAADERERMATAVLGAEPVGATECERARAIFNLAIDGRVPQ